MSSRTQRPAPVHPRVEQSAAWAGDVTWRDVAERREALFDQLEAAGCLGVRLDVRAVTSIDRTGIALLIGANHRALATGRRLVIIDDNGPVTSALARMHMLASLLITQTPVDTRSPSRMSPAVLVWG